MIKQAQFKQFLLIINLLCSLNLLSKSMPSQDQDLQNNSKKVIEIASADELKNYKTAVLEFYSTDCGACKMFSKKYANLAQKYPDINFLKIDGTKHEALIEKYDISAFPSFILVNHNWEKPTKKVVGGDQDKLEKALKKISHHLKKAHHEKQGNQIIKKIRFFFDWINQKLANFWEWIKSFFDGKSQELISEDLQEELPKDLNQVALDKSVQPKILDITSLDQLEKTIKNNSKPVIARYHAQWCGHCRNFAPIFAELARTYANKAIFIEMDDQHAGNKAIAQKYQITGLPTTLVFKNQNTDQVYEKVIGADRSKLVSAILSATNQTSQDNQSQENNSKIIEIKSQAELDNLIKNSTTPVVVDYHAENWCGACKMYKDLFASFAYSYPKLTFAKADHDLQANQPIASQYQITGFPTTLIFNNGQKIQSIVGINIGELQKALGSF